MPSPRERVIGVAASAGGVEALRQLVADLPEDLDAALCVVLHIPPAGASVLAPILDRVTSLKVVVGEPGAPLERGVVYVAPNDHHLEVHGDRVELSRGPKENGVRPAADPMFRSIARNWGRRGVAVVLSGALDDGAAGAAVVKEAGGCVLAQDPDEAPVSPEPDPARLLQGPRRPDGPATGFTCPECNGALWELREGGLVRHRCRVGHAYAEQTMVDAQGATVEAALWSALEALEERHELLQRIATRGTSHPRTRARSEAGARGGRAHCDHPACARRRP